MDNKRLVCLFIIAFVPSTCWSGLSGPNVCYKEERESQKVVIQKDQVNQYTETDWCLDGLGLRCSVERANIDKVNEEHAVLRPKIVEYCCEGYTINLTGDSCIPVCSNCNNGTCVAPELCECNIGYGGPHCNITCPLGTYSTYGEGDCKQKCKCENDATCDPYDGTCICVGFEGKYCENKCSDGTFGENCSKSCDCNFGHCDPVNGDCICKPVGGEACLNGGICDLDSCICTDGWTGPLCESPCPAGFFGINCTRICTCNNGASCSPVTGECICKPGFAGSKCKDVCPNGTYGVNCTGTCTCRNNATCSHVDGKCTCLPGFFGPHCSEECDRDDCYCRRQYTRENCARSVEMPPEGKLEADSTKNTTSISVTVIIAAVLCSAGIVVVCYKHRVKQLYARNDVVLDDVTANFTDETTKKSDEICTFPQPSRRNLYVPDPYLEENNYEDIESFHDYDEQPYDCLDHTRATHCPQPQYMKLQKQ